MPRPPSLSARIRSAVVLAGLAALFGALNASPAFAHEGSPRLVVEPDRVNPGGVLTIRLEDLPPERTVDVMIAAGSSSTPLASVETDPEGHGTFFVELPADLAAGGYLIRAHADGVAVQDVAVTVEGAPIVAGGGVGHDEGDLLVALPSGWQRSLSGPIVTARPLTETLPAGLAVASGADGAIAASLLLGGFAVVAVLGLQLRRRA
jgi:hypothetical protein